MDANKYIVLRVVEYEGPPDWMAQMMERSIKSMAVPKKNATITYHESTMPAQTELAALKLLVAMLEGRIRQIGG